MRAASIRALNKALARAGDFETVPSLYTTEEGGEWKAWPQGIRLGVDFYFYRGKDAVEVCLPYKTWPLKVHSLVTPYGYRWDCINGWTGRWHSWGAQVD